MSRCGIGIRPLWSGLKTRERGVLGGVAGSKDLVGSMDAARSGGSGDQLLGSRREKLESFGGTWGCTKLLPQDSRAGGGKNTTLFYISRCTPSIKCQSTLKVDTIIVADTFFDQSID